MTAAIHGCRSARAGIASVSSNEFGGLDGDRVSDSHPAQERFEVAGCEVAVDRHIRRRFQPGIFDLTQAPEVLMGVDASRLSQRPPGLAIRTSE